MENEIYEFDKPYLWEIPYGSIIEIKKEDLIEIGELESFKLEKEKYQLIKVGRCYADDSIYVMNLDTGNTFSLPNRIVGGEDFEICNITNKEQIDRLIKYQFAKTLDTVIGKDGFFEKSWEESSKDEIKTLEFLTDIKKAME